MRYSDKMKFGIDILYLDNDTMIKNGPTTISKTSLQQFKAPMIL